MPKFLDLQTRFDKLKALKTVQEDFLLARQRVYINIFDEAERSLSELNQAINVFSRIAELSRRETIDRIEGLITFALRSIFDDNSYKFFIEDVEQKTGVVYNFLLQRFNLPPIPIKDATGGGVLDVISTFLAIIVSILQNPKQRRFFVLDERFKHVSKEHQARVAKTLRYFADKLDCQFLIVSHTYDLSDTADLSYLFSNVSGTTVVTPYQNKKKDEDEE